MTTKTVDEWCAAQAGVIIGKSMYTLPDGKRVLYPFTLNDARCREIVREHFRIYTYPTKYSKDIGNDGIWSAYQDGGGHIARERTISKAEIACITAIYEASQ